MRRQLLWTGLLGVVAAGGCSTEPSEVSGTWVATVFNVTPSGEAPIDLLAAGATLTITIDAGNMTTGSLEVPAGVGGPEPFSASMAGTAIVTETTVRFIQDDDSFVPDLVWSRGALTLTVTNQSIGGDVWTITLTKTS
jgi:hypothetical protein